MPSEAWAFLSAVAVAALGLAGSYFTHRRQVSKPVPPVMTPQVLANGNFSALQTILSLLADRERMGAQLAEEKRINERLSYALADCLGNSRPAESGA